MEVRLAERIDADWLFFCFFRRGDGIFDLWDGERLMS